MSFACVSCCNLETCLQGIIFTDDGGKIHCFVVFFVHLEWQNNKAAFSMTKTNFISRSAQMVKMTLALALTVLVTARRLFGVVPKNP
jgi:hypothetical protein